MSTPGQSTISVAIGEKGMGKSSFIKREYVSRVKQALVWDFKGEYASLPNARLWTDMVAFYEHVRATKGEDIRIEVFACPADQFISWCRFVAKCGDVLVVIEELSRHCGSGRPFQELQDLFDRSRHYAIDIVTAGVRIADIPKVVIHQADEVMHARAELPQDIEFLSKWKGPELAERVRNLPPHQFIRITK